MSILSKVYKATDWYWGATRPPNPLGRAVTALHPHRFFILTAISTNAVSGIYPDTAFVFGMKKGKQPHPTKDNGCDIKYNLSDGT